MDTTATYHLGYHAYKVQNGWNNDTKVITIDFVEDDVIFIIQCEPDTIPPYTYGLAYRIFINFDEHD